MTNTMIELIENLPNDQKQLITGLLDDRISGKTKTAYKLNRSISSLELRYCAYFKRLDHFSNFYVSSKGKVYSYSIPAYAKYHQDGGGMPTGEQGPSATPEDGSLAGGQSVTDSLRNELNGEELPVVKNPAVRNAKPKRKQTFIQKVMNFLKNIFKKEIKLKDVTDLGMAYKEYSLMSSKRLHKTAEYKDLMKAIKRVDPLGHFAYKSNMDGWGRAKNFMNAVNRTIPEHTYDYKDFTTMVWRSHDEYVEFTPEDKITTSHLKTIAGKIKYQQDLPAYDK